MKLYSLLGCTKKMIKIHVVTELFCFEHGSMSLPSFDCTNFSGASFNSADVTDIQPCCVYPEADVAACYLADDVPDAVTAFYRVNDVAKFRLDRPFYAGDKSDGDVKVWTCELL